MTQTADPNAPAPPAPTPADATADTVPVVTVTTGPDLKSLAQAVEDAEQERFAARADADEKSAIAAQAQARETAAHLKATEAINALIAAAKASDDAPPMTVPGA